MYSSNTNEHSRQHRPHPMLGAQLGQYKILDVVGGGGMGVVFRAKQEMVDRDVALKLLPPELAHDEINSKRLEREAKALAKLNHPNIVTTFDFGLTASGQAYLVMELVDGVSMKELLLREGRLELERALRIFVQLADAMRFAHQGGIVHRDLKPHNVMIAQAPTSDFVKVLDFGIASLADSQKLTRVGEIIGSPLYMSPEQCLSEPVDARTDIYAFGVLMYVCLTGHVPFKGETLYETVEKKCTMPPPRFAEISPDVQVPGFLEELIRHCLAVEPEDRIQTMDEVKDLLSSIPLAKKRMNADATAVIDSSAMPSKSAIAPQKTIKEKMQENANNIKSGAQSAPQPTASRMRPQPTASRPAAKPEKSRQIEEETKGIVLTPGMLMIGIFILLACMAGSVLVGISVVYNGTFLPTAKPEAKATDTTGSVTKPVVQTITVPTKAPTKPVAHETVPVKTHVKTVETAKPLPPAPDATLEKPVVTNTPEATPVRPVVVKIKQAIKKHQSIKKNVPPVRPIRQQLPTREYLPVHTTPVRKSSDPTDIWNNFNSREHRGRHDAVEPGF